MDDLHRVFVGWPGGYFVTSLHNPDFHTDLQELVADLGPPTVVEFRAADEGWEEVDIDALLADDDEGVDNVSADG